MISFNSFKSSFLFCYCYLECVIVHSAWIKFLKDAASSGKDECTRCMQIM